jgi:hypothetical protein
MKSLVTDSRKVIIAAAIVTVLFSVWTIVQQPLLNNDAFSYLRAAEIFNSNGLRQVLQEYSWNGYSVVIALVEKILPFGLLGTAYLLNTLSYVLLTVSFIRLCMQLHEGPLVPFFAALAILCFPMINEMRAMLIRDFAFWAFAILSLQQLVRFMNTGYVANAVGWSGALFAAIFFRLEGMLLLITPLFFLTRRYRRKGVMLAGCVGIAILMVTLLALLAQVNLVQQIRFAYRYYLPQIFDLGPLLVDASHETLSVLFAPGNFPDTDNTGHGMIIVIFAYAWTVLANLVNALGIPITAFIFWCMVKGRNASTPESRSALGIYVALSIATLLMFVMVMHFLTQRYATLLCLLLLTRVPAGLQQLSDRHAANGRYARFISTTFLLTFYLLADSLVSFGYSTDYVNESIVWMRNNIPVGSAFHTNNFAIAHDSGLVEEYDRISRDPAFALQDLDPGDYIALDLHYNQQQWSEQLAQDPHFELIASFGNTRDDRVLIYLHH